MSDAPKSAFEIAMEKLRQQDQARGEAAPQALTDEQRRAIAEVRSRFQAKLAEAEILHRSNQRKAAEDPEALAKLEEDYQTERRRIEEQREREIAKVRTGNKGGKTGGKSAKKGKKTAGMVAILCGLWGGNVWSATDPAGSAKPVIVLKAARLLDPAGQTLRDAAVVVEGDRIQAVGPAASVPSPPGARVIDLGDATLLPGLIDAHTHVLLQGDPTRRSYEDQVLMESIPHRTLRGAAAARTALENGFTTLRDLGSEGAGYADVALRDAIVEGAVPGARLLVSTLALDISGAYPLQGFTLESPVPGGVQFADGPEEGRRAVREQVKGGADWIKVYCDRSYFVGKDGKLDSIPTFEPDELKAIVEEAHRQNRRVAAHAMAPKGLKRALDAGVDSIEHGIALDDDTIRRMRERGVFYCPTLMVTQYVAPARAKEGAAAWERIPALHEASFKAALKGGVTIVFGTDAGGFPWTLNEAQELSWMVRFGMRPQEALRAATATAARLLGLESEIGRIKEGYRADLIAVPGDPLARIETMENVSFVMQAGRVVKDAASVKDLTSAR